MDATIIILSVVLVPIAIILIISTANQIKKMREQEAYLDALEEMLALQSELLPPQEYAVALESQDKVGKYQNQEIAKFIVLADGRKFEYLSLACPNMLLEHPEQEHIILRGLLYRECFNKR